MKIIPQATWKDLKAALSFEGLCERKIWLCRFMHIRKSEKRDANEKYKMVKGKLREFGIRDWEFEQNWELRDLKIGEILQIGLLSLFKHSSIRYFLKLKIEKLEDYYSKKASPY